MRLAAFHPSRLRTHAPEFQRLLDHMNDGALDAAASLDWEVRLLASNEMSETEHLAELSTADGVIVMGGEDVDPRLYGGPREYPECARHMPHADRTQIAVIHECIARRIPLLGICRGHQLLNVALGGDLIQHLEAPDAHRRGMPLPDVFASTRITLAPGNDLESDVPTNRTVLCTHHQAIHRLGAGLRVAATAPDGVIEAVTHESAPATGVQWHPEHPEVARAHLAPLLLRLGRQFSTGKRSLSEDDVAAAVHSTDSLIDATS